MEVDVRSTGDDAVLVTVRDTGEGIAAADLARILDRYQRRADTGGSGLGLAIVRDLAAAHGGTVTARERRRARPRLDVPGHGCRCRD